MMALLVYSMRERDPREFKFPLDMTIAAAAEEAAKAFGYTLGSDSWSFCEHTDDKYQGALVFDREATVSTLATTTVELANVGGSV